MRRTRQQLTGQSTENLACQYLEARGLILVERNFQCRRGEIDLIMTEQNCLVFVEVRFRRTDRFGSAMESVNIHKQRRLIATAEYYLQQKRLALPARFDVIAISGETAESPIQWIQNAFAT